MIVDSNDNAEVPVYRLSFRQWQVWAVLALAASCGYLSWSLQQLSQNRTHVATLLSDVQQLQTSSSSRNKLVGVQQLLPQVRLHAPELAQQMDQRIQQTDGVPATKAVLTAWLGWLGNDLQHTAQRLQSAQMRGLHLFYWAVVGFLLALVAAYARRRQLVPTSELEHLLADNVLFQHLPVAAGLSDRNDRLVRVNAAFEQLTGFATDQVLGSPSVPEDALTATDATIMQELLARGQTWQGDFHYRHRDGRAMTEKVLRVALRDCQGAVGGYLTMALDPVVSDDEKKFMLWQAHHDNLTKLPNANLLHERLTRALVTTQTEDKPGALISIDIDNFQKVNDSVGHSNADRLLTDAAYRIAMCARETDTVARMGGDLFVIMVQELDDVAEAERIARTAVEQIAEPFLAADRELFLTASAGIVVFPADGDEKGELLQKVDAARMNAKQAGGNQVRFFEAQMNSAAARRLELETYLRKAVANNEFELHYQPVVDIGQGRVYGAEALLRWHHPELGMVSPGEFIPVAEDSGLIVPIGEWVIDEVLKQIAVWRKQGLPELRISLNVSAKQLCQAEHAQRLLAQLEDSRSASVTIELTESALVDEQHGAQIFLQGLKDAGIQIALDDFGTGYSSVAYLRAYEFDVLKIDKCFIDGLDATRDYGLVASIVAMGRILGMRVVAEGVEESHQLKRLQQIGCDFVQGYYYSKPLPVADFEQFVLQAQHTKIAS